MLYDNLEDAHKCIMELHDLLIDGQKAVMKGDHTLTPNMKEFLAKAFRYWEKHHAKVSGMCHKRDALKFLTEEELKNLDRFYREAFRRQTKYTLSYIDVDDFNYGEWEELFDIFTQE